MKDRNSKSTKYSPLYKIPEDWEVVMLGKVAEVVQGFAFPIKYQTKNHGRYPFVKVGDMNLSEKYIKKSEFFIDDIDLNQMKVKIYPPGTIIFPKIGMAIYLNKYRILSVWGTIDNNVAGLVPTKRVDSEFLFYWLSGKLDLARISGRTTTPSIKKTTIQQIPIPLPPLPEQKRIAEVLLTVDEAIEKVDKSIEKTERLKKGLMHELLTKGIGHKEFKNTEIGKIPKEWEVRKLGEVVELKYGKGLPARRRKSGNVLVLGSNGIVGYHDKHLVNGPGIVIGRKGSIGEVYYVKSDFWPIDTTYYVVLKRDVDWNWMFYMLKMANLKKYSLADVVPGLKRELVLSGRIPLPPLPEQEKIAEILMTVDRRLEMLREKKKVLERIKKGLMNDLLTGRRRLKVEPEEQKLF